MRVLSYRHRLTRAFAGIFVPACLIVLGTTSSSAQQTTLPLIKEESSMTYRLVHPLHHIEATSRSVEYAVVMDLAARRITRVDGQVDVSTFDSGNSNRDSHAMEVIDAISYPTAGFTSSAIAQKGDSLTVQGKLTFHGVTKDVTARAKETWGSGRLEVDGAMEISLTAFGVERPSLMLIPVEDLLSFTFKAVFGVPPAVQ